MSSVPETRYHMSDDFVCVTLRPSTLCGFSPIQVEAMSAIVSQNRKVRAHAGFARSGSKAPVADCQNAVEGTHGLPPAADVLAYAAASAADRHR
jgi:hypothetical protein